MLKKMGFLLVVLALSASNVSSMMRAGGGEAGAGDRRERHVSLFTFPKDDSDKHFVAFRSLTGKTVDVEVPSKEVSLAMLKVLVLEAFGHDAEDYSVKLMFGSAEVTNENFADYKKSMNATRFVVFVRKAVA